MKTLSTNKLLLLSLLALSSQLTGCFVSVPGDDQYYDYEESDSYDEYSSYDHSHESEEIIEEEFFEETIEESTTTTTTTTTQDNLGSAPTVSEESEAPRVENRTVSPPEPSFIFEETFESPELAGIDRVSVSRMSLWAIEWSPGSRCEHLNGTGSIEIQSEVDVGDQFEVEGLQHARLDGRCGQDLNPARILTSIADVEDAQTLTFYARVAETVPAADLMIEWNDELVMNEPLLNVWAEYTIDLTQVEISTDAILTITALSPGVLIDHIRVE